MKPFITILVLASMFLSCQKQEFKDIRTELQGDWNWVSSCGGFFGMCLTPASEGYTQKLEFSGKRVIEYKNGEVQLNKKYKLQLQESYVTGMEEILSNLVPSGLPCVVKLDVDTLYLIEDHSESITHIYIKTR